jgi:hypothetical protein
MPEIRHQNTSITEWVIRDGAGETTVACVARRQRERPLRPEP